MSESETQAPLTLISLESQNVKILRAVRITPEGETVFTIGGQNGAGKSSLLQSLQMSLCGGRAIPKDPIRHGQRHASVQTVLGRNGEPELTIELDLAIASAPKLVVKDKSGKALSTPQSVLNKIYETIGFDPLEFASYKKEDKERVIKQLAKLDFEAQDSKIAEATEARKLANRELKELDVQLKALPLEHRGVGTEEVSIKDLVNELSNASAHNAARDKAADVVLARRGNREKKAARVAELEEALERAREELMDSLTEESAAAEALAALSPAIPIGPIQEQLDGAEETNKKIRANAARAALEAKIRAAEGTIAGHDKAIDEAKAEKLAMISKAQFPVPELSFDPEVGLLMNGSMLEEASDGQKLRLSVAIAIALNPQLGIIVIRRGNLLDKAALRMITEMAAEAGVQVLLEVVRESPDGCSVFIEDGEIVSTAKAAE
jgi:energy-coupling factor transporter ATP-binding protein EcfA2